MNNVLNNLQRITQRWVGYAVFSSSRLAFNLLNYQIFKAHFPPYVS